MSSDLDEGLSPVARLPESVLRRERQCFRPGYARVGEAPRRSVDHLSTLRDADPHAARIPSFDGAIGENVKPSLDDLTPDVSKDLLELARLFFGEVTPRMGAGVEHAAVGAA